MRLRKADLQRRVKGNLALRFEAKGLTSFAGLELVRRHFRSIGLAGRLRRHLGGHGLETDYGKPFTTAGFGNWFRKQCDAASITAGYAAHGLRKAAGRRLAEAGCTAHEIMSVLGHKSLSEAERYTRGADQRKNARAAMEKVSSGTEQDQNLSNGPAHVSNRGRK